MDIESLQDGREIPLGRSPDNTEPLPPMNRLGLPHAWSGDLQDARKHLSASTNFRLPQHWRHGKVKLVLERLDGSFVQGSMITVTKEFESVPQPEIQFFNVSWTDSARKTWKLPVSAYEKLKKRLKAIYPISGLQFIPFRKLYFGLMPPDGPGINLLKLLEVERWHDKCYPELGCMRIYHGVLPEGSGIRGSLNGLALQDRPESWSMMKSQHSTFEHFLHAHEIAHNLYLYHAVNGNLFGIDPKNGEQYGPCCERDDPAAPHFGDPDIYFFGDLENVDPCPPPLEWPEVCGGVCDGRKTHITPLPIEAGVYRHYGLNSHSMEVVDPDKHFELMSYCGRFGNRWPWISDRTYKDLIDKIHKAFGPKSLFGTTIAALNSDVPTNYYLVPGVVELTTNAVELDPFTMVRINGAPTLPPPGEYSLLAMDASQNVIHRVDFQPQIPVDDFSMGSSCDQAIFMVPVLVDPRIDQIRIVHNENVLAFRTRSPNAPVVSIIFPYAGVSLDNPTELLSWSASDADGDQLTYTVQYSSDGGTNWETLAVNWPETTFTLDMAFLTGTTTGRFRVMASDSFNVGTGESEGYFSVPNHAPNADISWPMDDSVFAGDQQVSLEGSGTDREDGVLPGTSLEWRSDIDGFLGTGRNLLRTANELSEGNHILTLSATDSGGAFRKRVNQYPCCA